jgi:hypothetical protein
VRFVRLYLPTLVFLAFGISLIVKRTPGSVIFGGLQLVAAMVYFWDTRKNLRIR